MASKAKQIQDLSEKYIKIVEENEDLKKKLEELNENTVISSMKDMKEQYEKLMNTTVPIERFRHIKYTYKQYVEVVNAITCINNINIDKLNNLMYIINQNKPEGSEETFREKQLKRSLDKLETSFEMIDNIFDKLKEDCCCDCCDDDDM